MSCNNKEETPPTYFGTLWMTWSRSLRCSSSSTTVTTVQL